MTRVPDRTWLLCFLFVPLLLCLRLPSSLQCFSCASFSCSDLFVVRLHPCPSVAHFVLEMAFTAWASIFSTIFLTSTSLRLTESLGLVEFDFTVVLSSTSARSTGSLHLFGDIMTGSSLQVAEPIVAVVAVAVVECLEQYGVLLCVVRFAFPCRCADVPDLRRARTSSARRTGVMNGMLVVASCFVLFCGCVSAC